MDNLPQIPLCPKCQDSFQTGALEIDMCMGCLLNQMHKMAEDLSMLRDLYKNKEYVSDELLKANKRIQKMKSALEKLRDGPGNNMQGWKATWAHEFASKALEES